MGIQNAANNIYVRVKGNARRLLVVGCVLVAYRRNGQLPPVEIEAAPGQEASRWRAVTPAEAAASAIEHGLLLADAIIDEVER